MLRHQLASYSPITVASIARAGLASAGLVSDPRPRLLELLLNEYRANAAVLCGSGTQALQLAISLASDSLGGGAAVAIPAFSCFDVASAALGAGKAVVLYDIDPRSLAPDVATLERALADGARVVVVSALYGIPPDWGQLQVLADRYGAILVEDAAQGHGASWRGRRLGTLGEISTLSFGRGKGWTGGFGGAVLLRGTVSLSARTGPTARPRRSLAAAALLAQWILGRPSVYGIPRSLPGLSLGVTMYHPPVAPAEITRAAAEAILANHDESSAEAVVRKLNAAEILSSMAAENTPRPMILSDGAEPGYLRLPLFADPRHVLLGRSGASCRAGIERSYPATLAALPSLAPLLTRVERHFPGAECLAERLITVPTHSRVTAEQRRSLIRTLHV